MVIKPNWKTIWNVHILDRLYFFHKSQLSVDDIPITSIAIDGREVKINDFDKITDTSFIGHSSYKVNYYLNKVDADAELIQYVTKHLAENSEDDIKNPIMLKHYQKVLDYYKKNIEITENIL